MSDTPRSNHTYATTPADRLTAMYELSMTMERELASCQEQLAIVQALGLTEAVGNFLFNVACDINIEGHKRIEAKRLVELMRLPIDRSALDAEIRKATIAETERIYDRWCNHHTGWLIDFHEWLKAQANVLTASQQAEEEKI